MRREAGGHSILVVSLEPEASTCIRFLAKFGTAHARFCSAVGCLDRRVRPTAARTVACRRGLVGLDGRGTKRIVKKQNEIKVKRTAALEHEARSVSQSGAGAPVPPFRGTMFTAFAKLFPATENTTPRDLRIRRKFFVRRGLVYALCLVVYILLDRSAMFLQMWPNISAWYPPVGFAVRPDHRTRS